jgi:hypothetical protein
MEPSGRFDWLNTELAKTQLEVSCWHAQKSADFLAFAESATKRACPLWAAVAVLAREPRALRTAKDFVCGVRQPRTNGGIRRGGPVAPSPAPRFGLRVLFRHMDRCGGWLEGRLWKFKPSEVDTWARAKPEQR